MKQKYRAYTLIELLCVLLISLISLSVLFETFVAYRHNFFLQKALSEIQENARMSIFLIRRNIQSIVRSNNAVLKVYGGKAYGWSPGLPNILQISPKRKTDVIVLQRNKQDKDPLIFFIKKTGRKNKQGRTIDALYLKENHRATEWVSGISDMKVVCYIQDQKGMLFKEKPGQVIHWKRVQAIVISLLLRSRDDALKVQKTYVFNHKTIVAQDRRLYRSIRLISSMI